MKLDVLIFLFALRLHLWERFKGQENKLLGFFPWFSHQDDHFQFGVDEDLTVGSASLTQILYVSIN